jgi:hypothetical protein
MSGLETQAVVELSPRFTNLANERFARLTAIEPVRISKLPCGKTCVFWLCRCDCGNTAVVLGASLRWGQTKSCGCALTEHALRNVQKLTQHGLYQTPEYEAWKRMKRRCRDASGAGYRNYGGRGIGVCKEWQNDFLAFLREIGPKPGPGYSVDRKDNNRGYEPGNVRWATRLEQNNNRRTNRNIEIDGVVRNVTEWCRHFNQVSPDMALGRIRHGWPPAAAVSLPRGTTKSEALATAGGES